MGLLGRVPVLDARRVELSAAAGLSYAAARDVNLVLREDGTRGRDLTREGLAAVFGAEATAWLTERVGLSAFAHQSVEARAFASVSSESFPTGRPDGSRGRVAPPRLSQWSVGVGLRVGRR